MEEDPELDPPPAAKAKQKLKTVIQTIKASSICASAALHAIITSTPLSVSVATVLAAAAAARGVWQHRRTARRWTAAPLFT